MAYFLALKRFVWQISRQDSKVSQQSAAQEVTRQYFSFCTSFAQYYLISQLSRQI
jgi:hypothetical protein